MREKSWRAGVGGPPEPTSRWVGLEEPEGQGPPMDLQPSPRQRQQLGWG